MPDATFDDDPPIDVLCVPGGWSVNERLEDDRLLAFLRHKGERARYVTSVCGGALLFGLALAAELFGPSLAQSIQLAIEYDPAPPVDSGSPRTAPAHVRTALTQASQHTIAERRTRVERAALRLR